MQCVNESSKLGVLVTLDAHVTLNDLYHALRSYIISIIQSTENIMTRDNFMCGINTPKFLKHQQQNPSRCDFVVDV